jgi:RNA-splicing ligase RtcB
MVTVGKDRKKMQIIQGQYNTAKVFATTIEESCKKQILELCDESWTKDSKIRIMPDCHSGKGCVIGTTMSIIDKCVPNMVGVDIGCGMLTTKFRSIKLDLKIVDDIIKCNIPLGRNIRDHIAHDFTSELNDLYTVKKYVNFDKVNHSIGSLGGGNHFCEIDKDEDDCFYLVIHTGSRNFGKRVAEFYQDKAVKYHKDTHKDDVQQIINDMKANGQQKQIADMLSERSKVANDELCYLEGPLFNSYLHDMKIAQRLATMNRKIIADILCHRLHIVPIEQFETVHNYIDTDEMMLRKGAISAKKDEKVLIPINMFDGSLICIGKGNPDFNSSAPHGAGRLMSRKEAKRRLNLDDFRDTMKDIYSTTVNESTLDEAPDAYKPIAEILENIKETVDVIKHIKPIYNIKSDE